MDWQSKTLDTYPIEHPWDQMAVHIRDMYDTPTMAAQLCVAV